VISAAEKEASIEQRNVTVEAYNTQQAQWFAVNSSQQAMINFYFRDGRISRKSAEVIDATKELDQTVFRAGIVPIEQDCASACAEARTASEAVKIRLRELTTLALPQLWVSQESIRFLTIGLSRGRSALWPSTAATRWPRSATQNQPVSDPCRLSLGP
jgi:hypothetical protein